MALPPATATPRKRRRPALQGSVAPLPTWAHGVAPKAVIKASERHREALDRLAQLRQDAANAEAAARAAAAADEGAALEAVRAGKQPKAPTAAEADQAVQVAQRAVPAGETLAAETQFAFVTALDENRAEFEAAVGAALEDAGADGARVADEAEHILLRVRDLRILETELEHLPPPLSRHQQFAVRPVRAGRDPLGSQTRELLDQLRAAVLAS